MCLKYVYFDNNLPLLTEFQDLYFGGDYQVSSGTIRNRPIKNAFV